MDLSQMFTMYQPLISFKDDKLFGFEALLRSETGAAPGELFENARGRGSVYALDRHAVKLAVEGFRKHGVGTKLFVNVLPSTLVERDFFPYLEGIFADTGFDPTTLVFELTETIVEASFWSGNALKDAVARIRRELGASIAVDDVGSGVACNRNIVEFEPDIVKLDQYFGFELSKSPAKQRMVDSYRRLAEGSFTLVLEGIEFEEDAKAARSLDVDVGQGYALGRPEPLERFAEAAAER
ncbi:EAL domain-containing protein [Paenibacillus sp.]|uniref:EAL domain-containing protein n=1 Tax=Paenibacillus sp. TaxID=58172 RepID=UPI002D353B7B|nr:EAL domain-containing protein [Paenibacillus sp.]HZG85560.1 EAL domain-containing protein [Paenibacillus sp.]